MAEACTDCGVLDALERHAGNCPRAVSLGLPRLAEGEEPIGPDDIDAVPEEEGYEEGPVPVARPSEPLGQAEYARAVRVHESSEETLDELEHRANRRFGPPPPIPGIGDVAALPQTGQVEFWMSYSTGIAEGDFDAVVFGTEIEALRHAVANSNQVKPLKLGESLREQARG